MSIRKARVKLMLDHPFFGAIMMRRPMKEASIPFPMGTDGRQILYNPDITSGYSLENVIGCLVHEVLHIAYEHHLRRGDRNCLKWNIAADLAINDIISEEGFELPEGVLCGWGTDDTAEQIYDKLPEPPDMDGFSLSDDLSGGEGPGRGSVMVGEVSDLPGDSGRATASELAQASSELKIELAQAAAQAKLAGKLSANMERFVDEVLNPQVNWAEQLRRFVDRSARNDYTWFPPNRRYVYRGMYLPSVRSETLGNLPVIVDTSASISPSALRDFASEINSILETHKSEAVVIYVDHDVCGVDEVSYDNLPLVLNPRGGGGTSFVPGFTYIDENISSEVPCILYLTDGYCDEYPPAPFAPVLWVCVDNQEFSPPFGEVVHIQERV